MKRFGLILYTALLTSGCVPTTHQIGYTSENIIEIKYKAYGMTPTLTAEATDIAVKHCAKYNSYANYRGASVPNLLTSDEVHTFACEKVKRDDALVIQSDRDHFTASSPSLTVCTNTGTGAICTSN